MSATFGSTGDVTAGLTHGLTAGLTGTAVAWRPAVADLVAELADGGHLHFTEVVAENVHLPAVDPRLVALAARGTVVVPHGVSLGLAGAGRPDPARLRRLAELATHFGSPLVSEHVAFVRAADSPDTMHGDVLEAEHLLPPPRTRDSLAVLADNIAIARDQLPVPLAVENIAAVMSWPEDELSEPEFLTELVELTDVGIVLDVANLYASATARGSDPHADLHRFPLHRIAYVHVAGGRWDSGFYLDTHADPVLRAVADLLTDLAETVAPQAPGVLLERDDNLSAEAVRADLAVVNGALV
ncbi:DUF692 family protein [Flexivirga sp. ID2601S]|uniref:DUF692 family protein n=1 Tax=Flexivirga aerilata TaxID=1656889 RepID=A0A849ACC9_9MICO|nr:DUF692 family multinuclear iron-containing protein [Flexivirga aerilata]NNG38175.1 DUF692 family protein [Flexivirga aerilata]